MQTPWAASQPPTASQARFGVRGGGVHQQQMTPQQQRTPQSRAPPPPSPAFIPAASQQQRASAPMTPCTPGGARPLDRFVSTPSYHQQRTPAIGSSHIPSHATAFTPRPSAFQPSPHLTTHALPPPSRLQVPVIRLPPRPPPERAFPSSQGGRPGVPSNQVTPRQQQVTSQWPPTPYRQVQAPPPQARQPQPQRPPAQPTRRYASPPAPPPPPPRQAPPTPAPPAPRWVSAESLMGPGVRLALTRTEEPQPPAQPRPQPRPPTQVQAQAQVQQPIVISPEQHQSQPSSQHASQHSVNVIVHLNVTGPPPPPQSRPEPVAAPAVAAARRRQPVNTTTHRPAARAIVPLRVTAGARASTSDMLDTIPPDRMSSVLSRPPPTRHQPSFSQDSNEIPPAVESPEDFLDSPNARPKPLTTSSAIPISPRIGGRRVSAPPPPPPLPVLPTATSRQAESRPPASANRYQLMYPKNDDFEFVDHEKLRRDAAVAKKKSDEAKRQAAREEAAARRETEATAKREAEAAAKRAGEEATRKATKREAVRVQERLNGAARAKAKAENAARDAALDAAEARMVASRAAKELEVVEREKYQQARELGRSNSSSIGARPSVDNARAKAQQREQERLDAIVAQELQQQLDRRSEVVADTLAPTAAAAAPSKKRKKAIRDDDESYEEDVQVPSTPKRQRSSKAMASIRLKDNAAERVRRELQEATARAAPVPPKRRRLHKIASDHDSSDEGVHMRASPALAAQPAAQARAKPSSAKSRTTAAPSAKPKATAQPSRPKQRPAAPAAKISPRLSPSQSSTVLEARAAPQAKSNSDTLSSNIWLPRPIGETGAHATGEPIRSMVHFNNDLEEHEFDLEESEVKAGPPNMSPDAYVRLSSLSEETMQAIRHCSRQTEDTCCDTEKLRKFLDGQPPDEPPYYLTEARSEYGDDIRCVKIRKSMGKGKFIGFFGGVLMETANHTNHPASSECLHISKEHLLSYGYEGPDLLICVERHKNVGATIRPPADCIRQIDSSEIAEAKGRRSSRGHMPPVQLNHLANIKPIILIHNDKRVVFVMLAVVRRIPEGHECLMVRSLDTYLGEEHFQLTKGGRQCHYVHARLRQLEQALVLKQLEENGEEDPEATLLKMPLEEQAALIAHIVPKFECSAPSTTAARRSILNFDVPFHSSRHKKTAETNMSQVFHEAQVFHIKSSFVGSRVEESVARKIKSLPEYLPKHMTLKDGKQEFKVDQEQLKHVLQFGFDARLVSIVQDLSLHSSVRLYTVPSQPAHSVVAKITIEPGTFLYSYAGLICEAGKHDPNSEYVYTIPADDVRVVIPRYNLPDLELDAKRFGGIGRFVNDNRYRELSYLSQESCINTESRWVAYGGMIHFAFYSTKRVKAGCELITHYGDLYWLEANKSLCAYHAHFSDIALRYQEKLEDIFRQMKIEMPPPPPVAIETIDVFLPKPVPYPHQLLDSPDDELAIAAAVEEENGEDVQMESILSRRVFNGATEYFVDHGPSSNVYPSWYSETELSEDLARPEQLAAFNAECDEKLAAKKQLIDGSRYVTKLTEPVRVPKVTDVPDTVPLTEDEAPSSDDDDEYVPKRRKRRRDADHEESEEEEEEEEDDEELTWASRKRKGDSKRKRKIKFGRTSTKCKR